MTTGLSEELGRLLRKAVWHKMAKHGSNGVVSSRLKHDDQKDLMWFFIEGAVAFDRSLLGGMLERAELFTFGSMLCPECEGQGYTRDPEESIRDTIAKVNAWPQDQLDKLHMALRGKTERGEPNPFPGWYDDGSCKNCRGCGWVPRQKRNALTPRVSVTVHPTGSSVQKRGGSEPNGDVLERYGHVLKRLSKLPVRHQETLHAFFGLAGGRWAEDRHRGRIWGLLPLTPAGHKLVKSSRGKAKKKTEDNLRDDEVLNVEAELQTGRPQKARGELFKAAKEQAAERLREAEAAWTGEEEKVLDRLRKRIEAMREVTA